MLTYVGLEKYEFFTEENVKIILTKNDIDTICSLAKDNPEFSLNQELEALAEKSAHWQELYNELKDDRNNLFDDIMELVQKHNIEEA
jgi:hypothetical protein